MTILNDLTTSVIVNQGYLHSYLFQDALHEILLIKIEYV